MRSTSCCAGVALAALAAAPSSLPAQPRAGAPGATHRQSACPIPAGWSATHFGSDDDPYDGNLIVNGVTVLPNGAYRWNGSPIDRQLLGRFLEITALMTPRPILALWPADGAGCADVAAASAFVDAHLDCTALRCLIADAPPARTPAPPAPPPPPRLPV